MKSNHRAHILDATSNTHKQKSVFIRVHPWSNQITCLFRSVRHRSVMRKSFALLFAIFALPAFAQMGGPPGGGGNLDNVMDQLVSANPVFSATMLTTISSPGGSMNSTTKMYYNHGTSRMEMNMADVSGSGVPPGAADQAKAMGMDQVIVISPVTRTNVYTIYPNLHCYLSAPPPVPDAGTNSYNIQKTKLGSDTVEGHPCEKYDVIVTSNGQTNELTVWNATDLSNFPIQIEMTDRGVSATMSFQNVSFQPASVSLFQPPSGYTRYDSPDDLLKAVFASRMGGGTGGAPATPSTPPPPPTQ
jgi:hypothetical protein